MLYLQLTLTDGKFEPQDAKKMYSAICRLEKATWSKWELSDEVADILSLSETLRKSRKLWKAKTHRQRNQNRDPEDQNCRSCTDLSDSEKCIQYLRVRDPGLKHTLENKLIIPEEDDAIGPRVSLSPHAVYRTQ